MSDPESEPLTPGDKVVRIGYHGVNLTLKEQGIITDKTIRIETIERLNNEYHNISTGEVHDDGISTLINICYSNLDALASILLWNAQQGITFYRASSELLPHITNSYLLPLDEKDDYTKLAYPIEIFASKFREIGDIVIKYGMRLTFHPGLHVVLNSDKPHVHINALRDIYYHNRMIELMFRDLDPDNTKVATCIVLHGGNRGNDIEYYKQKLIDNIRAMNADMKRYLVLENDERNYSIEDILSVSHATGLPVVFDLFHHKLYHDHKWDLDIDYEPTADLLNRILNTWSKRKNRMKIHISEQNPDGRKGNHSDYITFLPEWITKFPKRYMQGIDVMIEAKKDELALLALYKKYKRLRIVTT